MPRTLLSLALGTLLLAAACDRAPTGATPAPVRLAAAPAAAAPLANVLSGDTLSTTDFSEFAAGAPPEGWTQRWDPTPFFSVADDSTAADGRVLQWSATGQTRNRWALAYDGFGDRTDQSVYTDFRVRSLGGGTSVYYMGAAAVRVSGTAADERGYAVFFVAAPATGGKAIVLSTWSEGAYVQLGSLTTDWQLDTWYSVRLEAVGTTIRARVWPRGEVEPAAWQLAATDARYPSGRPGVSHHDNGTVQWDTWQARVTPAGPPPPIVITQLTAFVGGRAWIPPGGWTETSAPDNSAWMIAAGLDFDDGRALRNVTTVTGRHMVRPGSVPDTVRDQEVLVKMRMGDADDRGPGITLRHTMTGTAANAYVAYFRPGVDQVEINRFLNGAWSFVTSAPFPNDPGVWYWMRFRAQGPNLMVRVWPHGQPEPAGWTATGNDTGIVAGTAGLYTYEPNTVDYDMGSFANGGLTAPVPASGTPPSLAAVFTTPASVAVVPNETLQLGAYGRLANGDTMPLVPAWAASGGSISPAGVFTSSVTGTFQVAGTYLGFSDTTVVTVATLPTGSGAAFSTTYPGSPGALPAEWTVTSAPAGVTWTLAADAGAADGQVLRAVATTTARHILRLDSLPAFDRQEALTLLRMANDDERGPGLALRHSMSGSSETAYVAYLRSTSNYVEINRFLNGAWKFVGATSFVNDPGVWYWMRFRADGTTLQVRVWPAGTPEPAAWTLTATDDGIALGSTGVYVYESNTVDFDAFSAVNGPGTAPVP
jgi:hypothetical protein